MAQPARLEELYRQAVACGEASPSEGGKLAFFSFAERARLRGHDPGKLMRWLVRQGRIELLTQADEDAALERIRQLRDEECAREREHGNNSSGGRAAELEQTMRSLTGSLATRDRWWSDYALDPTTEPMSEEQLAEQDAIVRACLVTSKQTRIEPHRIAAKLKAWSKERWEDAHLRREMAQARAVQVQISREVGEV